MLIDLQVPISVVTSLWRRQNDIEVEDKAYKDGEVAGGWGEAMARMVTFTYREALGKWLLKDITFGINHCMCL